MSDTPPAAQSFVSTQPMAQAPVEQGADAGNISGGEKRPLPVDVVTQLQTCLGQLTTQMYASMHYLTKHHPVTDPTAPPQPSNSTTPNGINPNTTSTPTASAQQQQREEQKRLDEFQAFLRIVAHQTPTEPELFRAHTRELARDLVTKTRQIEELCRALPQVDEVEGENEGGDEGERKRKRQERLEKQWRDEEERQMSRIEQLTGELEGLAREVEVAKARRGGAVGRLGDVVSVWSTSERVGV